VSHPINSATQRFCAYSWLAW